MLNKTMRDRVRPESGLCSHESSFSSATESTEQLCYRLIHDDIWPTTADSSSNGLAKVGFTLTEGTAMEVQIWKQIKQPIMNLVKTLVLIFKGVSTQEGAILK